MGVDWSGQAEAQYLADDVGGLKIGLHAREVARESVPYRRFVVSGWLMCRRKLYHYVRVLLANTVGWVIGKNVRLRNPDIVADAVELVGGNYAPDVEIDLVD